MSRHPSLSIKFITIFINYILYVIVLSLAERWFYCISRRKNFASDGMVKSLIKIIIKNVKMKGYETGSSILLSDKRNVSR